MEHLRLGDRIISFFHIDSIRATVVANASTLKTLIIPYLSFDSNSVSHPPLHDTLATLSSVKVLFLPFHIINPATICASLTHLQTLEEVFFMGYHYYHSSFVYPSSSDVVALIKSVRTLRLVTVTADIVEGWTEEGFEYVKTNAEHVDVRVADTELEMKVRCGSKGLWF